MDTTNRNLVIVGVVALIVGVLIGYVIWGTATPSVGGDLVETGEDASESDAFEFTSEDDTDSSDVMEEESESVVSIGSGEETISTNDQSAGDVVVVDSVVVSGTSWIAVRDLDNGEIGNILGAQRLEAGEYSDVEVELLRPTEAGEEYVAVIFEDDGDLAFDYESDATVVVDGSVVLDSFNVVDDVVVEN